jgi:hypothetical protein
LRGADTDGRPLPNRSAKVAPAKDERLVRGGDCEVEVGSSAIAVAGERIYADGRWLRRQANAWFASSETVVGLMLTRGQQEPECIPQRVCCEMQAGNEDASKGSLAI